MYNDNQIMSAVNQVLSDMNLPVTRQITNNVYNAIYPSIANEMNKAAQSNQLAVNALNLVQHMMLTNQSQIMEIARLKKEKSEMPRMYTKDQVTGCTYCFDNGKEKQIGILAVIGVTTYDIEKNGRIKRIKEIEYIGSDGENYKTVIPIEKLNSKNLLPFFSGFVYVCKSKELANDFIAHSINSFTNKKKKFIPEHSGFIFRNTNGEETVEFNCYRKDFEAQIYNECSEYYINRIIPDYANTDIDIKAVKKKYFDTNEKLFLYTYSLSGLIASFLQDINTPVEQALVISAPNNASVRQASLYLQIFNRGSSLLSFDSAKREIEKELLHSKDETVIINDCSIVDNESRRIDMLQHTLTVNSSMKCLPHNLAVISSNAQYMISDEKGIKLNLPDDFAMKMTKADEAEMCRVLDVLTLRIIRKIENEYSEFRKYFKKHLQVNIHNHISRFSNVESATDYCIFSCVMFNIIMWTIEDDFISNREYIEFREYMYLLLNTSKRIDNTCSNAIVSEFINALNNSIINDEFNIIHHSGKMNYDSNYSNLVIKDDLLLMAENTFRDVIMTKIRSSESVYRIVKMLSDEGYVHSTKKNRYPLTVYSNGMALRPSFIAVKNNEILSPEAENIIMESEYSEWYAWKYHFNGVIPITMNSTGCISCQLFDYNREQNMHFFAMGNSGSGKTLCLTERMVSLQKLNQTVIIFDTSDSFTYDAILEKLSIGGNEKVKAEVKEYIEQNITFHKIDEEGIPIDILNLEYSQNREQKIRDIQSIIESHNSNMGVKQRASVYKAISQIVDDNAVDMHFLYEALTNEDVPYNLAEQLMDTMSFFNNFKLSNCSWGEFINNSKGIIIISTDSVNSSGGSGLIDMMLMSLFYYHKAHKEKYLSIIIDEIKTQNLSEKSPVAKILTEGRKYHIGLNFATQFLPESDKIKMIMENAGTKVFYQLDNRAASMAAKQLDIKPNELLFLDNGECYVKGNLFNQKTEGLKFGVVKGMTFRNFLPRE